MVDDFHPHDSDLPSALTNCPACGKLLCVILRDRPPTALPPPVGSAIFRPQRPPKHCPHCGVRLWFDLSARPTLALPADPRGTALIPKRHDHDGSKHASTEIITKPPPLT